MKIDKITEETLPLEKLNHLRLTLEEITTLENLVGLLNNRKEIIATETNGISVFEINERKIMVIKTDIELAKNHTLIIRKKAHVADLKKMLVEVLTEMEEKFFEVYEKLQKLTSMPPLHSPKALHRQEAKELLEKADFKAFDDNWELGIDFYLRAKAIVYPQKESKVKKLEKV